MNLTGDRAIEITSNRVSDEYLQLNCCGIQQNKGKLRAACRPEGRLDYHILYIKEGRCTITRDDKDMVINEGNIILYRPHEPQFYRFSAGENAVSYYLHFSGYGCEDILKKIGLSRPINYVGKSDALERIFLRLTSEYMLKKPLSIEMCTGLLIQFLSCASRLSLTGQRSVNYDTSIERICSQMHRDAGKNYSIAHYAQDCSLSISRFSHLFKEQTGVSPKQYLTKIKVSRACLLLENHGYTIEEAAQAVGIDDKNYFSRLIRQHTGHTPGWYRKF